MVASAEKPNTSKPLLSKRVESILTPECKSLLDTLPYHKSYFYPYLFLYQGFWYAPEFLNGVISAQKNFQANDSDVILVTFPKSGTTWFKALLYTLLNRSKQNPKSKDHPLLQHSPHDLVPFMEVDLYLKSQNPNLSKFAAPRLFCTHIPFSSLPSSIKSSNCKIVYSCRNPKDIVISLWQFANKVMKSKNKDDEVVPLEDVFDLFCCGMNLYGSFWEHTIEYWKASQEMSDKCLFVKFEEMKQRPEEQLRRVADFLGYPFGQQDEVVEEILRLCSFESLSKMEVNRSGSTSFGAEKASFFRRGEVGDWTTYFTKEMIQRIDRITEEKFRGSELGRNYTSSVSIISSI